MHYVLLFINIFSFYSLEAGKDVSAANTDLVNPEILCKSGKVKDNICNEINYDTNMVKDSSANLVPCSFANSQKCNYTNSVDNTTFQLDCGCAYNDVGSSWCPAAPAGGNYSFFIL